MVSYIKGGIQARIFENRILRPIFRHKRDENGEWRRLHNEDFIVCTVHLIYSG